MKHFLCVTCVLLAAAAFPALAAAQPAHVANSPKAEFHLSSVLVIGDESLKVGDYEFRCIRIEEKDFLVIKSVDTGKEVARVPCTPEHLDKKAEQSEMRTVDLPDGRKLLRSVRIKGDTMSHRVTG